MYYKHIISYFIEYLRLSKDIFQIKIDAIELSVNETFHSRVLPLMQDYIWNENYGVTRQALTKGMIENFSIFLPPLEEQHEIVRQVDKLFAFADKLEDHYKKAKDKIDKLPQSVLAKAFRGELVPQDPNDEPAEKLLERIKQEKERLKAISPGKKRNSQQRRKKRS